MSLDSFTIDRTKPDDPARAWVDMREGFAAWRLALELARIDLRNRYRGSVIGPFWVTLSTAVMSVVLGLLYGSLFKQDLADYLPYLATSLVLWTFLGAFLNDMVGAISNSGEVLRQIRMPVTVLFLRCLIRNFLSFAHSLPLIPLSFLAFGRFPGLEAVWALAGLATVAVVGFFLTMLLGVMCTRFRDVGPIVSNVTQLALFVTPVIWKTDMLKGSSHLMLLNPFYVMIEIVRAPLLGSHAAWTVWAAAAAYTAATAIAAWIAFVHFRGRLAFWI